MAIADLLSPIGASAVSVANLANSAGPSSSEAALAENLDAFLKLLTTQLRYQDPMEPLSSNEFIGQLTQFSQVEQSIGINKNLEKLLALQSQNQTTAALGFIGRTVEAASSLVPLIDGRAEMTYGLASASDTTTIVVIDENNVVVFSTEGDRAAGKHGFIWDGRDSQGNQLPDGNYRFGVSARDADGEKIETATGVVSRVTGVDTTGGAVLLSLGSLRVPLENIVSIRETTVNSGA